MNESDRERLDRELGDLPAPVELVVHSKSEDSFSQALEHFAHELAAALPNAVSITMRRGDLLLSDLPGITLAGDGRSAIHYICIPEQQEVVPFAHALAYTARGASPLSPDLLARVQTIRAPAELLVFVSPFCPTCPLVVEAANSLAAAHEAISVFIIDVQHVPEQAHRYQVQSVPALIIDRDLVHIGEITVERIVEILEHRGTDAYRRDTMRAIIERGNIAEAAELLCREQDVEGMLTLFEQGDLSMRMGVLVVFEEALESNPETIRSMVGPLISMLTNEDPRVRGDIADLLGKIGDPRALPHLEPLKNDPDPDVVDAAEEAIEMIQEANREADRPASS